MMIPNNKAIEKNSITAISFALPKIRQIISPVRPMIFLRGVPVKKKERKIIDRNR